MKKARQSGQSLMSFVDTVALLMLMWHEKSPTKRAIIIH